MHDEERQLELSNKHDVLLDKDLSVMFQLKDFVGEFYHHLILGTNGLLEQANLLLQFTRLSIATPIIIIIIIIIITIIIIIIIIIVTYVTTSSTGHGNHSIFL